MSHGLRVSNSTGEVTFAPNMFTVRFVGGIHIPEGKYYRATQFAAPGARPDMFGCITPLQWIWSPIADSYREWGFVMPILEIGTDIVTLRPPISSSRSFFNGGCVVYAFVKD
jgi:hypothetical protein